MSHQVLDCIKAPVGASCVIQREVSKLKKEMRLFYTVVTLLPLHLNTCTYTIIETPDF